jgi:hypothetical protein
MKSEEAIASLKDGRQEAALSVITLMKRLFHFLPYFLRGYSTLLTI